MSGKLLGKTEARIYTPALRELTPETSRGFACIEFAEEILEIKLFPWQKWLLVRALETLPDGTYRFRTVLLLVARQSGKSTLMLVLALWRMYADGAPLVIGTAQNLDISEELWTAACEMAESIPELAEMIEHVDKTNGKKALRLKSGERYKVAAASRRGGRGLSGDLVLLDELREHQTWDAWSAVTKTTMARARAQVWAASNAGDRQSVVLRHLRLLAHLALGDPDGVNGSDVGADGVDESLGIFEWSAAPDRDVQDREGWAEANPSLGWSALSERAISAAASTDPEKVFRTEVLCQWVDALREGVFPPGVWESNAVEDSFVVNRAPVVAIDTRTGLRQSMAIVVAGGSDCGDLVDVARYELGMNEQWAQDHIVNEVSGVCSRLGVTSVVVDKYGENAHLIPLLEDAGLTVTRLDTTDMRSGAVGFTDALINGRVKHKGQEPLNVAVLGAEKRSSGEGFLWSQARSSTDITPLRAATAAWWVYVNGSQVDYDPLDSVF
jgi:phage terminase large subunit-like protein